MTATRTVHCIVIIDLESSIIVFSLFFSIPLLIHMANWFALHLSKLNLISFYHPFFFSVKSFCKSSVSCLRSLLRIITFYCHRTATSLFSVFLHYERVELRVPAYITMEIQVLHLHSRPFPIHLFLFLGKLFSHARSIVLCHVCLICLKGFRLETSRSLWTTASAGFFSSIWSAQHT